MCASGTIEMPLTASLLVAASGATLLVINGLIRLGLHGVRSLVLRVAIAGLGIAACVSSLLAARVLGGSAGVQVLAALVPATITALWSFVLFRPESYRISARLVAGRGRSVVRPSPANSLGYGRVARSADGAEAAAWHDHAGSGRHADVVRSLDPWRVRRIYARRRLSDLSWAASGPATGGEVIFLPAHDACEYADEVVSSLREPLRTIVRLSGLTREPAWTVVPSDLDSSRALRLRDPWVVSPDLPAVDVNKAFVELSGDTMLRAVIDKLYARSLGDPLALLGAADGECSSSASMSCHLIDSRAGLETALACSRQPVPWVCLLMNAQGLEDPCGRLTQSGDYSGIARRVQSVLVSCYDGEGLLVFDREPCG